METPYNTGSRKGAWTAEEDSMLRQYIDKYGEGKWHQVPLKTGLNRCRKSCRLRWLNYLKPNIKRGRFSSDEVDLILRLHKLLGNRWALIAGRIPGRTANDIKNYWNTHLSKKKDLSCKSKMGERNTNSSVSTTTNVVKPRPQSFSSNGCSDCNGLPEVDIRGITNIDDKITCSSNTLYGDVNTSTKDNEKYGVLNDESNEESNWWESLLKESGEQLWNLFNEETERLD